MWNIILGAKDPKKIKHFVWKVCHNILPTREALHWKRLATIPLCSICKASPETIAHLLLLCPWTQPLWVALQLCPIPSALGFTNVVNWITDTIARDIPDITTWTFFTIWHIWKTHNDAVFNGQTPNPMAVLFQIRTQCYEFTSCLKPHNMAEHAPSHTLRLRSGGLLALPTSNLTVMQHSINAMVNVL